jgi:hypothetical protein
MRLGEGICKKRNSDKGRAAPGGADEVHRRKGSVYSMPGALWPQGSIQIIPTAGCRFDGSDVSLGVDAKVSDTIAGRRRSEIGASQVVPIPGFLLLERNNVPIGIQPEIGNRDSLPHRAGGISEEIVPGVLPAPAKVRHQDLYYMALGVYPQAENARPL